MRNRLFSATGAVWHCGPKRVKRTWWGTGCSVFMLLALAALTGWLWHCVKHATLPAPAHLPGVAMAPITQGVVIVAVFAGTALVIGLAVRKTRQNEVQALVDRFGEHPLQRPMTALDVAHIASAAAVLAGEIRLNATLALAGDKTKLPEIIKTAERQQLTLLNLKRSVSACGMVPEGREWYGRMGGAGS